MLIGSLSGAGGSGAAGDGQIMFGTGVDVSSHDITGERSTFRVGDTFAYRAYLSEQVPASELLIRATQTKTDGSQEVSNFPGPSSSAGANAITSSAARQLTDKDVGHWKLEILHGDSVVARGEFSVEAAGG